eukprot:gene42706-1292_t
MDADAASTGPRPSVRAMDLMGAAPDDGQDEIEHALAEQRRRLRVQRERARMKQGDLSRGRSVPQCVIMDDDDMATFSYQPVPSKDGSKEVLVPTAYRTVYPPAFHEFTTRPVRFDELQPHFDKKEGGLTVMTVPSGCDPRSRELPGGVKRSDAEPAALAPNPKLGGAAHGGPPERLRKELWKEKWEQREQLESKQPPEWWDADDQPARMVKSVDADGDVLEADFLVRFVDVISASGRPKRRVLILKLDRVSGVCKVHVCMPTGEVKRIIAAPEIKGVWDLLVDFCYDPRNHCACHHKTLPRHGLIR